MLRRILGALRGHPVTIQGTRALPEGESRKVAIGDPLAGGTEIVLCRLGGEILAIDAACPHEGGRIADGPLLDGRYAVCPLHGYKFDPRSGKAVGVACSSVRTYKARESGDDSRIWI